MTHQFFEYLADRIVGTNLSGLNGPEGITISRQEFDRVNQVIVEHRELLKKTKELRNYIKELTEQNEAYCDAYKKLHKLASDNSAQYGKLKDHRDELFEEYTSNYKQLIALIDKHDSLKNEFNEKNNELESVSQISELLSGKFVETYLIMSGKDTGSFLHLRGYGVLKRAMREFLGELGLDPEMPKDEIEAGMNQEQRRSYNIVLLANADYAVCYKAIAGIIVAIDIIISEFNEGKIAEPLFQVDNFLKDMTELKDEQSSFLANFNHDNGNFHRNFVASRVEAYNEELRFDEVTNELNIDSSPLLMCSDNHEEAYERAKVALIKSKVTCEPTLKALGYDYDLELIPNALKSDMFSVREKLLKW